MQYRRLAAHRMKQRATRRAACLATCRSRSQNALVTDSACDTDAISRSDVYGRPPTASPKRFKSLAGTNNQPAHLLETTSRRSPCIPSPRLLPFRPHRESPNRSEAAATQADFFLWAASASVNQSSSPRYCLARSWNCRSRELPCSSNASCTLGTGRMAGIGTPPR